MASGLLPASGPRALAAMALTLAAASALASSAAPKSPARPPAPAGVLQAGNGIYNVYLVDTATSASCGDWTAQTGPVHPAGAGHNLLFGGGTPDTSDITVRSYVTLRDYRNTSRAGLLDPGYSCSKLCQGGSTSFAVAPIGTTGFLATWTLQPDPLLVEQTVNVHGDKFENSAVEHTVCVTNLGVSASSIGIRYLWDWQIGFNDGPAIDLGPTGTFTDREFEVLHPTAEGYELADNPPGCLLSRSYVVAGTVTGPAWLDPPPTPPEALQFDAWGSDPTGGAVDACFAFAPQGRDVADCSPIIPVPGVDSAVSYYWGRDQPLALDAGEKRCVTAYLYAYADTPPLDCAVLAVGQNQAVCSGLSVSLDGAPSHVVQNCAAGLEYRWRDAAGVLSDWSATVASVSVSPSAATSYSLDVRCKSDTSCTNTLNVDVSVLPVPGRETGLKAVKQGGDVAMSWSTDADAGGGYRVYDVVDWLQIASANAQNALAQLACQGAQAPLPGCTHAGAVAPPPANAALLCYQVLGVCAAGGVEGPN